jgi:hypothetical protein
VTESKSCFLKVLDCLGMGMGTLRDGNPFALPTAAEPPAGWYLEGLGYSQRTAAVAGGGGSIPICAFPQVEARAIWRAKCVLEAMLAEVPPDLIERLLRCGCTVGVIGRDQVTTDIPVHGDLRYKTSGDGRNYDKGTRGLGGTKSCPVTTVAEENLTMENDPYWNESILVHEFGHTVMNCGFNDSQMHRVRTLHSEALQTGFSSTLYMFSNAEEFWANGTQAWFHAIGRTDVNAGIITRAGLCRDLPGLGALMREVYGDGRWLYTDDCPRRRW